jgi:hypothetical protein
MAVKVADLFKGLVGVVDQRRLTVVVRCLRRASIRSIAADSSSCTTEAGTSRPAADAAKQNNGKDFQFKSRLSVNFSAAPDQFYADAKVVYFYSKKEPKAVTYSTSINGVSTQVTSNTETARGVLLTMQDDASAATLISDMTLLTQSCVLQ